MMKPTASLSLPGASLLDDESSDELELVDPSLLLHAAPTRSMVAPIAAARIRRVLMGALSLWVTGRVVGWWAGDAQRVGDSSKTFLRPSGVSSFWRRASTIRATIVAT